MAVWASLCPDAPQSHPIPSYHIPWPMLRPCPCQMPMPMIRPSTHFTGNHPPGGELLRCSDTIHSYLPFTVHRYRSPRPLVLKCPSSPELPRVAPAAALCRPEPFQDASAAARQHTHSATQAQHKNGRSPCCHSPITASSTYPGNSSSRLLGAGPAYDIPTTHLT